MMKMLLRLLFITILMSVCPVLSQDDTQVLTPEMMEKALKAGNFQVYMKYEAIPNELQIPLYKVGTIVDNEMETCSEELVGRFYKSVQGGDYLPAHSSSAIILHHHGFVLQYDPKYEEADWVAEILTRDHEQHAVINRSGSFERDPEETDGASPQEYTRTGYDRGHMAPASDMKWSEEAMHECFYMTNMSPQKPAFNRGIWKSLETEIRNWALERDTLYVITGGILHPGLKHIGDHIAVPDSFFKVVLDPEHSEAIGFLLKNEGSDLPLDSFAVPVDTVEKHTGLHFFPQRSDSARIECCVDKKDWFHDRKEK